MTKVRIPSTVACLFPLLGATTAWSPPIPPPATTPFHAEQVVVGEQSRTTTTTSASVLSDHVFEWASRQGRTAVGLFGVPPANAAEATTTAPAPPTKNEILTLQKAFAAFYGAQRDPKAALPLLDESVKSFERQPPDERAGLYRVRGDCQMALKNPVAAVEDYSTAIDLLKLPESKDKADPVELPASILGRARAIRSLGATATPEQAKRAVSDYREALVLSSREEWDTVEENIEDGAKSNPYAAWEYGMALRRNGQYDEARAMHILTSDLFDAISDRPRAVISLLDAGVDAASAEASGFKATPGVEDQDAKALLKKAISYTTKTESRDVALLQRVVAKEGEGRIVLAAIEWTDNDKSLRGDAEKELSTACERLDQLEQDALSRGKKAPPSTSTSLAVRFNIDDYPGALETSCSRITKNREFQTDRLELPELLQEKIQKLNQLK
eukprot:jgi/Psemu1/5430/gm1.5430_g